MSVVTHATTVRTGRSRPDTVADLLRDSSEEDESDEDKPMKKATRKANLWLKEGDGGEDIVDLLDRSKLAGKIDSVDPKLVAARAERQKKQMDGGFKMSKDGRIIIGDLENNGGERIEDLEESDDESIMDCTKPKGKRKRSEVIDGRFDASYQPGGSGLHRKLDGKEASSRKRKGDTDGPGQNKKRRSGKEEHVQPYTYIPMEAAALNRRKRAKFQGRFNNLVRGARKGANKGKKQKRK